MGFSGANECGDGGSCLGLAVGCRLPQDPGFRAQGLPKGRLSHDAGDQVTEDIGQAEVAALITVG